MNPSNPSILITGGTGMIGRELVALLLEHTDMEIYLLLHQHHHQGAASLDLDKETLLKDLFSLAVHTNSSFSSFSSFMSRLHLFGGDITADKIGLSQENYQKIRKNITHIIHAAATTRFDLTLQEARRINVEGTNHLIRLAQHSTKIEQFGFLSTAYVSGKRRGTVWENELHHDQGFVNSYEQSKYESESVLEVAGKTLPLAIYRLSTVIGDSKTGRVSHFTAPHQALRMIYFGLAAMIPGTPDCAVDLIPIDYAARTIFQLFMSHFKLNQRFHITAGKNKSYTLREIIDESYRYLSAFDKNWGNRHYPKPAIVSKETFELFLQTAEQANNPIILGGMKALKHFAQQLCYPKQFDMTNLSGCLPYYEKELPDIRHYYHKVVAYCLRTKWGKHYA